MSVDPAYLSTIPDKPGCYLFMNEKGIILYAGKAKSLKKRVKSYFVSKGLDIKTKRLVAKTKSIDFIITDNEVEALILENSIIKKNQPRYNIDLKDSKNYAYIKITDDEYPGITIARRRDTKGYYYGPFVSAAARDHVLRVIKKIFKIRSCKKLPKKACIRYQIDLCTAPCIGAVSDPEYARQVRLTKMFLKGRSKELSDGLATEMKNASDEMNYEYALELKKKIDAIESLSRKQKMSREKKYNEDLINYIVNRGRVYLMLFNVYRGLLDNKQEFVFDFKRDFLEEFIIQYYSENNIPAELLVPEQPDVSVGEFLKKIKVGKVRVVTPKIGEKKALLDLVRKNIELTFFGDIKTLESLKDKLSLSELPVVIECFDISHISGSFTTASMVQFRNGLPDKSNYRRFRIKYTEGIDDVKSIGEVVSRRYNRLKKEEGEMPDLILIDGGSGQLNGALNTLKELNINIPVVSIAKREEEIYIPGEEKPLKMGRNEAALHLIQRIRDEAHRFAITYNRLLRKKDLIN